MGSIKLLAVLLSLLAPITEGLGPSIIRNRGLEELAEAEASAPDEEAKPRTKHIAPLRIAVLTASSTTRYFMRSTVANLLAPLVREKCRVHYFLALDADKVPPPMGNLVKPDPAFKGHDGTAEGDGPFMLEMVNSTVSESGAKLISFNLREGMSFDTDSSAQSFLDSAKGWWNRTAKTRPANFRVTGEERRSARESALRHFTLMEQNWAAVLEREELAFKRYDWVILVQGDAVWEAPFSINKMLNTPGTDETRIWAPSCVETRGAGHSEAIAVIDRDIADEFCTMRSNVLEDQRYWSVWDSSALFMAAAKRQHVAVQRFPNEVFPVQRGAHVLNSRGKFTVCLPDLCRSAGYEPRKSWPRCVFQDE